jgi:hypothetical protein
MGNSRNRKKSWKIFRGKYSSRVNRKESRLSYWLTEITVVKDRASFILQ